MMLFFKFKKSTKNIREFRINNIINYYAQQKKFQNPVLCEKQEHPRCNDDDKVFCLLSLEKRENYEGSCYAKK